MIEKYDIDQPDLISRLQDRFGITLPPAVDRMGMLNLVHLVSNADDLLKVPSIKQIYNTDPGGVGWKACSAVPEGKRWTVFLLYANGSAGTCTSNNLQIQMPDGTYVTVCPKTAAQTVLYDLAHPLILDERWLFNIYISAYNAADTMTLKAYVHEEDAF